MVSANEATLNKLNEEIEKNPEKYKGTAYKVSNVLITSLEPGSHDTNYFVKLKNSEKHQFLVDVVFDDREGQTLKLTMWKPFTKMVGMTPGAFVGLPEQQKKVAIEKIDSEARYEIMLKLTKDGFRVTCSSLLVMWVPPPVTKRIGL